MDEWITYAHNKRKVILQLIHSDSESGSALYNIVLYIYIYKILCLIDFTRGYCQTENMDEHNIKRLAVKVKVKSANNTKIVVKRLKR